MKRIKSIIIKCSLIIWIFFLCSLVCGYFEIKLYAHSMVPYIAGASILFALDLFLYFKYYIKSKESFGAYIISFIIAFYSAYRFISGIGLHEKVNNIYRLISFCSNFYTIFITVSIIISVLYGTVFESKKLSDKKWQFIDSLVLSLSFSIMVFIYIPSETFFSSFTDYNYPYQLLIKSIFTCFIFWTFVLTAIQFILVKKIYYYIHNLLFGIMLAVYIQYMFFNTNVGILDGSSFNPADHLIYTILNTVIWLALIIVPMLFFRAGAERAVRYITAIVGLIHMISLFTLIMQADKNCFCYTAIYYSFEEQYTVGNNRNEIVFVIDAADNCYMKELVNSSDPILNEFGDFTMYTNTCSVYDYTNLSMLQMMTNFQFDNTIGNLELREKAWNTPWCKEFYDRYHSNGYKVNVFNFDYENSEYVIGKIDNANELDQYNPQIYYIDKKLIKNKNLEMIAYRSFPLLLKSKVNLSDFSLIKPVIYYSVDTGYYDNESFDDNIKLSSDDGNYLIVQHISGVHEPNDNVETMRYTLEIVDKYLDQMKELGVYEDATIIITADHGITEKTEKELIPATPVFLIKEPGVTHDVLQINDTPIYHTDIMPTLLYNAGLYKDQEDRDLFGTTIYDYSEDSNRTRIWYDRYYNAKYPKTGKHNVFAAFEYTGNTDELNRCVNERDNMTDYPMSIGNE